MRPRFAAPYVALIVVTAVALTLSAVLVAAMNAPIAPACFEYCELGRLIAGAALTLLWLVWLLIVVSVTSLWVDREPHLVSISGFVAAIVLCLLAGLAAGWFGYGKSVMALTRIAVVLAPGLQLVPAWRLVGPPAGSLLRRLTNVALGAIAGASAGALVLGGSGPFSPFYGAVYLTHLSFVGAVTVVAIASWRRDRGWPVAALALAGLVHVIAVMSSIATNGRLASIVLVSLLLLGIAWLGVGLMWLRSKAPRRPVAGSS